MLAADVLQLLEMVVSCEVGAEPFGGLVVTAFRAVSPPGEQCGGGPHRDVPGRRFRAPGSGMFHNVPLLLSHACPCAGWFDGYTPTRRNYAAITEGRHLGVQ